MDVRLTSRRLRDLCEPIAANVYFAPEVMAAYEALGLDYPSGYFCSRSACMGKLPGEVVAAAFGVFNPKIVVRFVSAGWTQADPESVLAARLEGATSALRRILGDIDPTPAVNVLRPVMESCDVAGRMIFSGLVSLPFPADPVAQLWRVCDWVREHRGDAHIAAWVGAGCDPIEIGLLTELYYLMPLGTNITTRGWSQPEIDDAVARLERKGHVREGAFTEEGRRFRSHIESATDAMEAEVVEQLGDRSERLFAMLEPWTRTVIDSGGYPFDTLRPRTRDDAPATT